MNRKIKIGDDTQINLARDEGEETEGVAQSLSSTRPEVERVQLISVAKLMPDPDQPRTPLLPAGEPFNFLRERFVVGEIDCFEAAKEWMAVAKHTPGHARRIQFLLDMATGFDAEEGGQVNPITAVWTDQTGVAMIETGEQRFWAKVLGYVKGGMKGDSPKLRTVIRKYLSRKRQVLENRHIGPPTAVSQAREIATLFLSEGFLDLPADLIDVHPAERDPFAIHRWVMEQRKPHKSWQALEEIMSMSDRQMRGLLEILVLPTHLLQIADIEGLSQRQLLGVVSQPPEAWEELILLAVEEGWTGDDIAEAVVELERLTQEIPETKPQKKVRPAHVQAYAQVKAFVKVLNGTTEEAALVIGQVADEIATAKDAKESYAYLAGLTEQVRLRLAGQEDEE